MHGDGVGGVARWSRALVLASVVVMAGVVAHTSAGGEVPGGFEIAALSSLCVLACAALLGRHRSPAVVVALTVGGQIVVHTSLGALAGHGATGSDHANHLMTGAEGSGAPAWWTHGIGELLERPQMAGAHLLSAAVVGCWLAIGERALWALVAMGSSRVAAVAAACVVLGTGGATLVARLRRPTAPAAADERLPQLPLWSRGPARRGPPAVLLTR